jgi:hypothetical protein
MVRAPANYIRPFRSAGGGGGGVKGGGGGGGGGGGRGGGGGWNGWGPEPGNPWWGNPYDSWIMRIGFSLITAGVYVDPTVEQNAADWEAIRDFVKAKAQDLNNLMLDAPATQERYNSGGFAFIDPNAATGSLGGIDGLTGLGIGIGAAIGSALAAAGAGLAQLWGYLNDRQGAEQPGNWQGPVLEGVFPLSVVEGQGNGSGLMAPRVTEPAHWAGITGQSVPDNATVYTYRKWTSPEESAFAYGWTYRYAWMVDGVVQDACVAGTGFGNCLREGNSQEDQPTLTVSWVRLGTDEAVPEAEPVYPSPAPNPEVEPKPLPAPQPSPAQPAPLPLTVPALPGADPVAPPANPPGTPGTTPATPPATRPQAPPVPTPLPVETPTPEAEPTENGALVPKPAPPPVVTPEDAHIVNGSPVRSPGPAPTPEGIAKEVGRIEEKLASLMDPKRAPDGDNTDRLGLLFQLAQQIFEFLTSVTASGEYTLSSPCVLDGNDQRIVQSVQYGGAMGPIGLVSNKVDALAELIQVHKDLKQPICRQTPAVGQPVTVNFVQTD